MGVLNGALFVKFNSRVWRARAVSNVYRFNGYIFARWWPRMDQMASKALLPSCTPVARTKVGYPSSLNPTKVETHSTIRMIFTSKKSTSIFATNLKKRHAR